VTGWITIEAYSEWPKVRDLVLGMSEDRLCSIDWGHWTSPIRVYIEDPGDRKAFLEILESEEVKFVLG